MNFSINMVQPLFLNSQSAPRVLCTNLVSFNTFDFERTFIHLSVVCWADEIVDMHSKEIALKTALVEKLPACRNKDTLAIYASAWLMQPYIDKLRCQVITASIKEEFRKI
jgi:hypothetical protein